MLLISALAIPACADSRRNFFLASTHPATGGGGGGTDINAGLSAWWPCDEGTGTTVTNGVAGGPSITSLTLHYWTNGAFGNGFGWTTTDTRTYGTGVSPGCGGATKASFSVWMKRAAAGDKPYWALVGNDAANLYGVALSWQQDDKVRLSMTNGQNVAFTLASANVGTWYNILFVYDGTQATMTNRVMGYLNGVAQALTFTGNVPTSIHPGATNSYPCRNPVGGNFYIGQLDDLRVWTNNIGADVISSVQTNQ